MDVFDSRTDYVEISDQIETGLSNPVYKELCEVLSSNSSPASSSPIPFSSTLNNFQLHHHLLRDRVNYP